MENKLIKIKEAALELLVSKNACREQLSRVRNAQSEDELLQIAKDNFIWCSKNGACPDHLLAMFNPELLLTAGIANTGEGNTGLANTGDRNTGNSNTGYRNTGDSNTGNSNTGNWNTGYSNTGYSNTGNWNTGNWNTGSSNTGYSNTGNWNTGDRNTGYSNTGDRNTGAFCTGEAPFPIFNQPSNWTEQQFKESKAYSLLCQVDTKQWIPSSHMTEEEKAKYPSHSTCEGYLKDIPFKEAFQNAWHTWSENNRKAFFDLPNFSWEIFTDITGVKPE